MNLKWEAIKLFDKLWISYPFRIGYCMHYAPRWMVFISPGVARAYSKWRKFG